MKKMTLIATLILATAPMAHAEVTISGKNIELSQDCFRLNADNVKIRSDDCDSSHGKSNDRDQENRSVQGSNNPGKGHDKAQHKDKGKK